MNRLQMPVKPDSEGVSVTAKEVQIQIQYASQVVRVWPAWKRNILSHSSQPTNSRARTPVEVKSRESVTCLSLWKGPSA